MGLLKRKPKIGTEEFCREFYDTQVFHPVVAGTDVGAVFWETAFDSVVEADQSFAAIDKAVFQREIMAIRLELFGLAWGHRFKQDKFAIEQTVFTKHYLEERNKSELWDIMGEYHQAIAESAMMTETGEQDVRQAALIMKARVDMFDKWVDAKKVDPSNPTEQETAFLRCVARVAGRIGTDIRRNDCILVKRLGARLADRLGCDINLKPEALFKLGAVIFGLYEGAIEAIKSVNLKCDGEDYSPD